jgi:hypothetical protein
MPPVAFKMKLDVYFAAVVSVEEYKLCLKIRSGRYFDLEKVKRRID